MYLAPEKTGTFSSCLHDVSKLEVIEFFSLLVKILTQILCWAQQVTVVQMMLTTLAYKECCKQLYLAFSLPNAQTTTTPQRPTVSLNLLLPDCGLSGHSSFEKKHRGFEEGTDTFLGAPLFC